MVILFATISFCKILLNFSVEILDFKETWVGKKGKVFSFYYPTSNYFLDTTIIQKGLRIRYVQLQFLSVCIYIFMHLCRLQEPNRSGHGKQFFRLPPGRIGLQNAAAAEATASGSKQVQVFLCPPCLGHQTSFSPHNLVSKLNSSDRHSSAGTTLNAAASCCIVQCRHPWKTQEWAAHHLGTAAVKLLRSLPTFWPKHSSKLQGELPQKHRKEAQKKDPQ